MRDEYDRYVSVALLLLGSALAGFAFAFTARKAVRELRAELARRRFRVVRGSLGDDMSSEGNMYLLRDE